MLIFFMTGLLLAPQVRFLRELLASREEPAFSSHLRVRCGEQLPTRSRASHGAVQMKALILVVSQAYPRRNRLPAVYS